MAAPDEATNALRVLRQARLFRQWPADAQMALARQSHFRRLSRRSSLTRPGAMVDAVIVVVTGLVEVGLFTRTGKRLILHNGGPGYSYGLLKVLQQPAMPQYLSVLEASELLIVPGPTIRSLLDAQPPLWQSVAMELAYRYRKSLTGISVQLTASLSQRLALSLYALVRTGASESRSDGTHCLKVSQADLAATLGMTRQSVNRELQNLAQSGLLSLDYGRITVNDPAALRRLCEDLDALTPAEPGVSKATG